MLQTLSELVTRSKRFCRILELLIANAPRIEQIHKGHILFDMAGDNVIFSYSDKPAQ